MTNSIPFPWCWKDLPHPLAEDGRERLPVAMELQEAQWRKVVGKHLFNSKEPWSDVVPPETLKALVGPQASSGNPEAPSAPTQVILAVLGRQIFRCLQRPLLLQYLCIRQGAFGQGRRWLLILPCGAVAIVWSEQSKNIVKTCYFTGGVAVKPKERRWRHAVRQQVQENAVFDELTGDYVFPDMKYRREVDVTESTLEMRYGFRFVSPEAWGFASGTPGAVWRLPNWQWLGPEQAVDDMPGKTTNLAVNG